MDLTDEIIAESIKVTKEDILQYFTDEFNAKSDTISYDVDEEVKTEFNKVINITDEVMQDITIFTRVLEEQKDNPTVIKNRQNLAKYRGFPENFFLDKGILYSPTAHGIIDLYPDLSKTSIYKTRSDLYHDRYLIPVTLSSGKVLTFMGYHVKNSSADLTPKYEIAKLPWTVQQYWIGNQQSITRHKDSPVKIIFITEGFMDAFRAEQIFMQPAFCIFGSQVSKQQRSILKMYKNQGYYLIHIRDNDTSGKKEALNKCSLWDSQLITPETLPDGTYAVDFDRYCLLRYKISEQAVFTKELANQIKKDLRFTKEFLYLNMNMDILMQRAYDPQTS